MRLSRYELEQLKRRAQARYAPTLGRLGRVKPVSYGWRELLRWQLVSVQDGLRRWHAALPGILAAGFIFTLGLWVAVFATSAAILATPGVPLRVRYGVGLAALVYLYVYALVSGRVRTLPGSAVIFTAADAAAAALIYLLSAPYVGYAHLLLFFAVARMAARFQDVRAIPAGLLLTIPFLWPQHAPAITLVLECFGVLMLMLGVQHMLGATGRAHREAGIQSTLATITSSLARAGSEGQVLDHLATLAPPVAVGCAWAFWVVDASTGDFRSERWYGVPSGERPITRFTPELGSDGAEPVELMGPLPGTSYGEATLVQPMSSDGRIFGLVMVSGRAAEWGGGRRQLIRAIAAEAAVALARVQTLTDQRRQADAMETANRLAAIWAARALDPVAALDALLPALQERLTCESVHLEWLVGSSLRLGAGTHDPLHPILPPRLPASATRAADAIQARSVLVEPVTGRRPEDVFLAPAGIRHVAVVPLLAEGVQAAMLVGRREPRPFTESETQLLRLLVERISGSLEAGLPALNGARPESGHRPTRLVMET